METAAGSSTPTATTGNDRDAKKAALVDAYASQAARAADALKSLRHTLLRGPSASLRELAGTIAARMPETPEPAAAPAALAGDSADDDATGEAPAAPATRADWLAMVAQVGWLQGEPAPVILERYRSLRSAYGTAGFSEIDVTAYLAAGGTALSPEERAELRGHPSLKATARASAGSDAAADENGVASEAHLAALSKILAIPANMPLTIRAGRGTGPSRLSSKLSVLDRAKSVFRESETPPSPVTVIVSTGAAADVAVTTASLGRQLHPKTTVVTQGADESLANVVARAPGDLLLFLSAGSWAGPALAGSLAAAFDAADGALVVVPSGQWVDDDLRFAPAGSLLRLADPSSALVHRRAFAEAGELFDVPADEALDEFVTRVRRSAGASAVARVTSPTLVLHPARPLELIDPVIPTQDWRAAFRIATADTGRDGGVTDTSATRLPFAVQRRRDSHFDVVFISSLSRAGWKGGSQESMLQEIRALAANGLRLGLVHLEAPRVGGPGPGQLSPAFQQLIDDGRVERLTILDSVTTDIASIRYPPVLQFSPDLPAGFVAGESGIRAGRVIIEANQGPAESDGTDRRYLVDDCDATVLAIFGRHATWYPQGPLIRRQLEDEGVAPEHLGDIDLPGILDPADWAVERAPLSGRRPVVGRYSRDHPHKWPDTWELALMAYGSADFDFTSMGGHDAVDELRGDALVPSTWTLLGYNETEPREFLAGLDFFAYFHHSKYVEAFGRAIAEAMASGAVVILPPSFAPVFGDGAVYCEPADVAGIVARLAADPAAWQAQSAAGQQFASQHFGYDRFARAIESIRTTGSAPAERRG